MSLFAWLFGKKEQPAPVAPAPAAPAPAAKPEVAPAPVAKVTAPPPPEKPAPPSEAENLRRWRESGRLRAWIEAHQGQWNHAEWLALLDELKRSSYWPMQPNAIGLALEEAKRDWLRRN